MITDSVGTSAFGDIPLEAADEAEICIRIDKDLYIEHFAQRGFGKDQDPFHDDDSVRLDSECLCGAAVGGEIVDRHLNSFPVAQRGDVFDQ